MGVVILEPLKLGGRDLPRGRVFGQGERDPDVLFSLWPSWLCEPLRPFHLLGTLYVCKMKTKCPLLLGLNKDKVGSACGSVERVC